MSEAKNKATLSRATDNEAQNSTTSTPQSKTNSQSSPFSQSEINLQSTIDAQNEVLSHSINLIQNSDSQNLHTQNPSAQNSHTQHTNAQISHTQDTTSPQSSHSTSHLASPQNHQKSSSAPTRPIQSGPIMMDAILRKPKNKLIPVTVILGLLAAASIGINIFLIIQTNIKTDEINFFKNEVEIQKSLVASSNQSGSSTTTDQTALAQIPHNLLLTNAKCLNNSKQSGLAYNITNTIDSINGEPMIHATLDINTNKITLNFDWDKLNAYNHNGTSVDLSQTSKTGLESFSDLKFSGKITDIRLVGNFGNTTNMYFATLFALMEDGTIEYIPLRKAIQTNSIRSYGKLGNITNVIKFYDSYEISTVSTGGGNNTLAQCANGDYYDLYQAITSTGNYK